MNFYSIQDKQKILINNPNQQPFSNKMLLVEHKDIKAFYAPFDFVNHKSRLVIIGISPGKTQASSANSVYSSLVNQGVSHIKAEKIAKEVASFRGPLRSNLIKLLDSIGIHNVLNLASSSALFTEEANQLVHYTSAFRYPVLKNGKPISSAKGYINQPILAGMVDDLLTNELLALKGAIILPLGQGVADLVLDLASKGIIDESCVLTGLPHPSGANAERIKYFLGEKSIDELSVKTNPITLDIAKETLVTKVMHLKKSVNS
ncbi:hypothetical protein DBZ36_01180 [Alginatibacterium sediminis]|uniref:Uracil-DNA glycosylase-like domain-containing protein n=1 Tax=Alginatibacterium sediminis TaxID=2164068 RepID=A0A420ENJ1_9ALTE|nr:hypothetical protein [Alginatibacterium sediminis]RKF22289.1 hypothetical protein DBZ36_01180 [Alginatibacterium sediminis]